MTVVKNGKKIGIKLLSVILSVVLVLSCMPVAFAQDEESLVIPTISDLHYVAEINRGNYNDAYLAWGKASNKQVEKMDGFLESAFAAVKAHSKVQNIKYLFVPGDLSANGEISNHEVIADKLIKFEKDTGIQVIVTNGNHDINNTKASSFAGGTEFPTKSATPEQFKKIYKNLGWDLAYHTYSPSKGNAGMLSYSVKLDGGYRLIVIDAGMYSADNTKSGLDKCETGGTITPDLLKWIVSECEDAKAKGETVLGMSHWNVSEMNFFQGYVLQGFVVNNREVVSDTLADAGMHWIFTGHQHCSDIASTYSDKGEVIYNIMTPSILDFPNSFRETVFTKNSDGSVKADFNVYDCDCVLPITDAYGTTYTRPYRVTTSLPSQVADFDLAQYVLNFVSPLIDNNIIPGVKKAGGIVKYVEQTFDIDLKSILNGLINGGITIAGAVLFDAGNIMNLINDIDKQLTAKYINDPAKLKDLIYELVDNLSKVKVADAPCTKFINSYGFGDENRNGNISDLAFSVLTYFYSGNENIEDDVFMQEVLDNCLSGEFVDTLVDALVQYLIHDILIDDLLSNIEINIGTVLGLDKSSTMGGYLDVFASAVLGALGSDRSAMGIINMLLEKGIVKKYGYTVDGIIDNLREEYLSGAFTKGLGYSFYTVLGGMVNDSDPYTFGDSGSVTYSGPVKVDATTQNYRLPTIVTVTMGNDPTSSANISWYTRYSVTGTDIEIFDEKGNKAEDVVIDRQCIATDRSFPGVDLGVFGFFNYTLPMQRHIVKLSGLEKGKEYTYRVGDSEKGWWSDTGVISTADGSNKVNFIHISDSQCSSPYEYETLKNTLAKADSTFDYDYMLATGDLVDQGNNLKQWQWAMDQSSDYIMNSFMAPVSGNHEAYGENATVTNFVIPNIPEQDTGNGVYYSFDYNNVHTAVINFNDTDSEEKISEAQIQWLIDDIKKSNATWKVLAIHCSLYSNSNHADNDDVCAIRDQLKNLLPQIGVDMVFTGHDHVYLRTNAMADNNVVTGQTGVTIYKDEAYNTIADAKGTVYSAGGTVGTKHYVSRTQDSIDNYYNAEAFYGGDGSVFTTVSVIGNKLYVKAYALEGDNLLEIDKYALIKTFKLGDVNGDGKVNTADAKLILRSVARLEALSDAQKNAADVNKDGYVLANDARKVLRAVAKIETL